MIKEFTSLVGIYQFSTFALRVVLGKAVSKPLKRWPFGDSGVTMLHACEIVSDKDPTCHATNAFVVQFAGCIFLGDTCEAEVNGETLLRLGCNAG